MRAGRMAQWIKCLLPKCDDLSPDLQRPCEKLELVAEVVVGCVVDTYRPLELTVVVVVLIK